MAKILIVDDRPLNREFLATLLGYYGHTLAEAADGVEGLARVGERKPDLVITDLDGAFESWSESLPIEEITPLLSKAN